MFTSRRPRFACRGQEAAQIPTWQRSSRLSGASGRGPSDTLFGADAQAIRRNELVEIRDITIVPTARGTDKTRVKSANIYLGS